MKKKRKMLLPALAAASLCLPATGLKALSITTAEYEIGSVMNNSGSEVLGLTDSVSTPRGIDLSANPQSTVFVPVSGTFYASEGELHHNNGQGGGGGGNDPSGGNGPTGTVPDTGSTFMLLGTAMIGIAWARSKLART